MAEKPAFLLEHLKPGLNQVEGKARRPPPIDILQIDRHEKSW